MKLTVSLVQMSVASGDPETNLKKAEGFVAEAAGRKSDLVCFPEMWTTGFDWKKNEEIASGQYATLEKIAGLARKHKIWINGSMLALNEDKKPSNTSILFDPEGGQAGLYRKTHLFTLMNEQDHMSAGNSFCAADTPWGPVGLAICYDLRFPEIFRTYALKGAKIILMPSAFPHPRIAHWKTLIRARAIEDQLFMIAANRTGSEDHGKDGKITYFGDSCIIDPWGETVAEAGETEETVVTATIDTDKADETRSNMTVLKDRRPELYGL